MILKVLKQKVALKVSLYQLRAFADDDLCRGGWPLNYQLIGYGFDSPPSRRPSPYVIVSKLSSK